MFENISITIKKRHIFFYGDTRRMEPKKTVDKILTYQKNRKAQVPWMKEVLQELGNCGIGEDDIGHCAKYSQSCVGKGICAKRN